MKTLITALFAFFLVHSSAPVDFEAWADSKGYQNTNAATSSAGSMIWVASDSAPALDPGMDILGSRYDVIWSDPAKRAAYNGIVHPDGQGNPRPFAVFAGEEKEMGL